MQKNNKLNEVMNLFMNDNLTFDEYKKMKFTLEKDIEDLKKDILKEEKKNNYNKKTIDKTKISKNIKEHWINLTIDEKIEFLNEFVEKIVIVNRSQDKANGLPEILEMKFYDE